MVMVKLGPGNELNQVSAPFSVKQEAGITRLEARHRLDGYWIVTVTARPTVNDPARDDAIESKLELCKGLLGEHRNKRGRDCKQHRDNNSPHDDLDKPLTIPEHWSRLLFDGRCCTPQLGYP